MALNFTSFCAFYEEIEWGEPDWGDTYQKAGQVCLLGEDLVFEVRCDFVDEREQDLSKMRSLGFMETS